MINLKLDQMVSIKKVSAPVKIYNKNGKKLDSNYKQIVSDIP